MKGRGVSPREAQTPQDQRNWNKHPTIRLYTRLGANNLGTAQTRHVGNRRRRQRRVNPSPARRTRNSNQRRMVQRGLHANKPAQRSRPRVQHAKANRHASPRALGSNPTPLLHHPSRNNEPHKRPNHPDSRFLPGYNQRNPSSPPRHTRIRHRTHHQQTPRQTNNPNHQKNHPPTQQTQKTKKLHPQTTLNPKHHPYIKTIKRGAIDRKQQLEHLNNHNPRKSYQTKK